MFCFTVSSLPDPNLDQTFFGPSPCSPPEAEKKTRLHGCQIALKEHRERLIFAPDITWERVEWETLQAGGRNKDVLPVGKRGETAHLSSVHQP